MRQKSANPYIHVVYWILVIVVLTLVFGLSWGNKLAAFYFVSMLLPIVLGTSYFFNYFIVPTYFLKKRYFEFGLYTLYTIIVSLYLETIVLLFTFVYLGHFSFYGMGPNTTDSILFGAILYLLVFLWSFFLLAQQLRENQQHLNHLLEEKEKLKRAFLELRSNRKLVKIPYEDIVYIESLADYIRVNTTGEAIVSKEKISTLADRLPEMFLRIHRSFIVHTHRIKSFSYDELIVDKTPLTIGRSYRKAVRDFLKEN